MPYIARQYNIAMHVHTNVSAWFFKTRANPLKFLTCRWLSAVVTDKLSFDWKYTVWAKK